MTPSCIADKRAVLARCDLFAALGQTEQERLAGRAVERRFANGQTIFSRGDPGSSMMAVLSGQIRVAISSPDGREVLLSLMGPGEIVGELALLDGRPRSADAVAVGDCRLLVLDRRDFLPALRRSPEAAIRLCEILGGRIREANDQLEGTALMSVESALARLLLRLAARQGDGGRIENVPPQRDLGRLIGASRQEVNRHLSRWSADGVIERRGTTLVLLDAEVLAELAGVPAKNFAPCQVADTYPAPVRARSDL